MATLDPLIGYIPPIVRRRLADGLVELPHVDDLQGAVLITDISGFTRMTEQMRGRGPEGVELLTTLINAYFGRLIDTVDACGGEVASFTGDGLIAIWPSRAGEQLAELLRSATDCALELAEIRSELPGAPDVKLSVRLGVSAGQLQALEFGGLHGRRFVLHGGEPLDAASLSSEVAATGQVAVDDDRWPLLADRAGGEPLAGRCMRVLELERPARARHDDAGLEPRPELIAPYIPPPVISREGIGRGAWLAELRRVTVVFLTLPEVHHTTDRWLVQQIVTALQLEFDRYEATINSIVVDAKGSSLLAATGLPPLSHDDDPVRGVRAAMAVARVLAEQHWQAGVGVATGRAFCGPVGNALRREYTIIGDVVNTAARLASRSRLEGAGAISVLSDAATERATRQRIDWGAGRELELKGKAGKVAVFSPLRRRAGAVAGEDSATVGRRRERDALTAAVRQAATGVCRLIVLEGEPGMGKSRLLHEAAGEAQAGGTRCLHCTGDAIERVAPYHAWRGVFATVLQAGDSEDPAVRAERVLQALPPERRPLAPLLNLILGLELPDTDESALLQGERRVLRTRQLLLDLLADAAGEPLLIAIDDGHWLDSASWALIQELVGRQLPICVALATRPGAGLAPEYGELLEEPGTERLALAPLDADEAVSIACNRLGVRAMPAPVVGLVVEKAAGNPLFTEELAYALRDSGFVEIEAGRCTVAAGRDLAALALPDTVEGIIGSRIDRLEPQPELVLKVASAVGQTFAPDVIRDVYPLVEDRGLIDRSLETLVRRDLTIRLPPPPSVAYSFRHALTREVAYNRMLFAQRRELHIALAGWYERRFADNLAPVYANLAYHYSQAGDVDNGCQYLALASEQAFTNGMSREAANLGLRAAELLGEPLPRESEAIGAMIGETVAAIGERMQTLTVDQIGELPPASDARRAAAIGALLQLEPPVFVSGQVELFALIGLRNFLLTLDHGATPFTPGVVAIYAMIVRAMHQDPVQAFALSALAERLAERDSPPLRAYAGFVHHFFIKHWLEPLGPDLHDARANSASGFEHGDWMFGCFNIACHLIHLETSGAPLDDVIAAGIAAGDEIAGRTMQAGFHAVHETQLAKALAGRTVDRCSFTDRPEQGTVEEEHDLASITNTDLHEQIGYYLSSKLRLHFLYREYRRAVAFGERAEQHLAAFRGEAQEVEFTYTFALALFARYDETGDPAMLERARGLVQRVRDWHAHAPAVFAHKLLALDAAEARVGGDHQLAAEGFLAAAAAAGALGYTHHVALAYELAGRALLEAGAADAAREQLTASRATYERWGARAKVADLDEALASLSV